MIGLLVSLAALLFAAGGMACHIWTERSKLRRKLVAGKSSQTAPDQVFDPAEETEVEP
ncbi:MAG: hypothetical protein ABSD67_00505 [Terracidiphilus sp.]